MIHALVFSSSRLLSEGIACLLKNERDIRAFAVTEPACFTPELYKRKPDVILADYFVFTNLITAVPEGTKTLLLDTGCSEGQINYAFITRHISGVVDVNADETMLVKAIRSVCNDTLWIGRPAIKSLLSALWNLTHVRKLTGREITVLSLLREGCDDTAIGQKLGIEPATVSFHIENIKRKIGVTGRRDLKGHSLQCA